ncbi:hypothetical protein CAPTEDRAFT_207497 [Capitella teleta]|uniref:N-acetyltransferase domain-containing protein n=1 Tax=Capitella teleta TaxID=283909 RepID=R7UWB6_CAPTE|nr:hypothetical protein CAPTEDRAFT_207497 [Capitella teleta]|eukprot:ELU07661.1 hypothetical protein CAPTEDRAFT_207497 [Capitella teleta]
MGYLISEFPFISSRMNHRRGPPANQQRSTTQVKQVVRTEKTRRDFRRIARESSGEAFDTEDGDKMFFAYNGSDLIGVGSLHLAARTPLGDESMFLSDHFHNINFVFVKSHHKHQGHGSCLLRFMLKYVHQNQKKSVRVQSAAKAVNFFQKHGFESVGEPFETLCGGSPLFNTLVNMQRTAI